MVFIGWIENNVHKLCIYRDGEQVIVQKFSGQNSASSSESRIPYSLSQFISYLEELNISESDMDGRVRAMIDSF